MAHAKSRATFESVMQQDARHEVAGELARAALAGASPSYLMTVAVNSLARETRLDRVGANEALTAAAAGPRHASADEQAFVSTVSYVLELATSERRAQTELAQRSETLRAFLESTPDVVLRLDRDLRCSYVNQVGERLMSSPASGWLGRTACDLDIPEPNRSALVVTLRNVAHTGREQELELRLATVHGERDFQVRVVPEFDVCGEVAAILTVWRDVSRQVRAEDERALLHNEIVRRQAELHDVVSRVLDAHAYDLRVTAAKAEADRLTGRQREILKLLAAGWSNREIAVQLGLKTGTVKNHVASILSKLDVSDRIQAAVRAVELGLVDPNGNHRLAD
jgi:PAS domain S-box-containing protein